MGAISAIARSNNIGQLTGSLGPGLNFDRLEVHWLGKLD
jgi:hypothetical protein